jgi:microcystin-dependent protein
MAKPGLQNIATNNTFQNWLDRTNEIVDIIKDETITASVIGDTTGSLSVPLTATLIGSFTANTITAATTLRADSILPRVGSLNIAIGAPVTIISSGQSTQTLVSSSGPRSLYSTGSVLWQSGFLNNIENAFIIDTGTGTSKFSLSTNGTLTLSTGTNPGTINANVSGNISGDLVGDVYASDGTTKILENGNGTTIPAVITGNVVGNVIGNLTGNADTATSWKTSRTFTINGVGQSVNGVNDVSWTVPTFPVGGIIMWSGSIASIPSGWALCNGSNGTPDMRNRFIVGAGSTYSVGATGGADSVTLTTSQIPSHTHTFSGSTNTTGNHNHLYFWTSVSGSANVPDGDNNTGNAPTASGPTSTAGAHSHTFSGTTAAAGGSGSHENRPPYYALAYIMKI